MQSSPGDIQVIWVYLSGSPLLALFITLAAYHVGVTCYEKSGRNPVVNPVAIAVALVAVAITLINMPYKTYFDGAQFVHFLLGTATVSLAVPIYRGLKGLGSRIGPLVVAQLLGAATSIVSAVGIATLLGATPEVIGGFWAKSVTAPIGMGIAERLHVSATLTAVFAVCTGILGAIVGRYVLDFVGSKAWWQRGFALGIAAHGIGTSRAFSVNREAGTYASLGMGLNGVISAVLIPLVVGWYLR